MTNIGITGGGNDTHMIYVDGKKNNVIKNVNLETYLEDLIRNKFTIQYKSNKDIDPFFSYEIFNPSNSGVGEINEYRLSVGGAINLSNKKSAKIYYMYKIEDLDKKNSEVLNVIGLSLSLN